MRSSFTLLSLLAGSALAVADATPAQPAPARPAHGASTKTPATNLAPIDLQTVPEQCRTIAKQAGARVLATALSARISLAACLADVKLAPLELCDCEESMLAIDEALKPTFALLDEVIVAAPDDVTKIIAERAKAELHTHASTRMMQTLPPASGSESAVALYEARKAILDGLLARWRDAAAASYERILATVKANPKLERNPVVASAMRIAKDRLRLHVAVAKPAPAPAEPVEDEEPETDASEELR